MPSTIRSWFTLKPCEVDPFDHTLAIYSATRIGSAEIDPRIQQLRQITPSTPAVLCELELLRLRAAGKEDLIQAIPSLRREFASITGKPISAAALDRSGPDAMSKLLAEASFLTVQIARSRALQETFAFNKTVLLRRIAPWLPIALLVAGLIVRFASRDPTLLIVILIGGCGGIVSICIRISKLEPGPDLAGACLSLRWDFASLIAKPVLGATFAVTLYLLFIAGMVKGSLFPVLAFDGDSTATGFREFFSARVCATFTEYSKLLVWCFLAGFAERFVPDILNRLAAKSSADTIKQIAGPNHTD